MKTLHVESEVELPVTPRPGAFSRSPDGSLFAARSGARVSVYAVAGLARLRESAVHALESASAWALAPDGARLALAKLQHVWIVDEGGKTIAKRDLPDGTDAPRALAWDREGERLWASMELGEEEEADVDGLVTHVFALELPTLAARRRGWVPCDLEGQAHRLVPLGDRCVLRISCGQDGAWVYAFAPGGDDARLEATAVGASEGAVDVAGFGDGVSLIVLADDRVRRLGWPGLEPLAEQPFEGGASLAEFADACDGVVFAPVSNVDAGDGTTLLAYDATSLEVVAKGVGLVGHFVAAAAGGRAILAEPRGERCVVRVVAMTPA